MNTTNLPCPWDNIAGQNMLGMSNVFPPNVDPNKPRITIAIPYNGRWDPEWAVRAYLPLCYIPVDWCIKAHFLCKVPSIPTARDTLVDNALQTGCQYIFFLDTDVIFESPADPNIALNMLYQVINKDPKTKEGKIVSGLYRAKQKTGFSYAAWVDAPTGLNGFIAIDKWTGNYVKVDVVGMGCCLIDIQVFKNLRKPYFKWELNGEMSEDFHFCKSAAELGYDTHVFTDVKLSHLGNIKVKTDGTFALSEM